MKPLPPLPPGLQQRTDQFHASCVEMLDAYVDGFHRDFNRHAVKHGPMPEERAVSDITRLLVEQVRTDQLPMNMLAGLLATAIVRGIAGKAKGKG